MPEEFSRLPTCVLPKNYKVHLKPDLQKFTFSGECDVSLEVREETESVVCNASNLEFQKAEISGSDGETFMLDDSKIQLSKEKETVTLLPGKSLKPGSYVVKYFFTGILNDQMRGFYRSKYFVDGEERYLAVTQFESTDARQAFPCWDEPAVKATFDIIITGPANRVILSNMPQKSEAINGDEKTITFDTTPVMSTYLVAIVIGEFDFLEAKTTEGIQVRVYAPLGKKEQGSFALDCAVKALSFYHNFFHVPYPLTKYDMVAIPDFSAGAMENWGLVTYREVCILVDSVQSSRAAKEYVAIVVCHETAHQWFGNLVTMEWWTHLWLNEGFASFMENLTTDVLYPEFKIWEQFVPGTMLKALKLDALSSSHPIEVPVGHPTEVDEIFDNISYNKGASVIRMLYNWIGSEAFRSGMKNYLTKYSFQNCETPQLWAELEAASNLPVTSVMKTWTEKMGFPLIKVKSRQEGENRILTLSQAKFMANGGADPTESMWQIPISIIRSNSDEVVSAILDQQSVDIKLSNIGPSDWVKLNPNFVGFYRTVYDKEMLDSLCLAVTSKKMSDLDRLNILDDVFSLITGGQVSTVDCMALLKAYKSEDSYIVWNSIASALSSLYHLLVDQDIFAEFKMFALDLLSEIKVNVTWDPKENESHLETLQRSLIIGLLGKFGDEEVRMEAKRRFDQHVSEKQQIAADIRSAVYSCVAASNNPADFDAMVKLYKATDLQEEKDRVMRAGIGGFGEKSLVLRALEFSVSDNVRSQDSVSLVDRIAQNGSGRDLAWQFFKDNFQLFKSRYPCGFLISHLVKTVSERFLTVEMAVSVEKFFSDNPIPGTERNVTQAVETIRLNSGWLSRDIAAIRSFFRN